MFGVYLPVVPRGYLLQTHNKEFNALFANLHSNEVIVSPNAKCAKRIVPVHAQKSAREHHVPAKEATAEKKANWKHLGQKDAEPYPIAVPSAGQRKISIVVDGEPPCCEYYDQDMRKCVQCAGDKNGWPV
jgi:hypothetical protein